MSGDPSVAWAILPKWEARYPLRYSVLSAAVLAAVLGALAWAMPTAVLSALVAGAALGGGAAVLATPLVRASVVAGVVRSPRALAGVNGNQILGIEVRDGTWARTVELHPVGVNPVRLPQLVSWRLWPTRSFDQQVAGLRLALGFPAEPTPEPGAA